MKFLQIIMEFSQEKTLTHPKKVVQVEEKKYNE